MMNTGGDEGALTLLAAGRSESSGRLHGHTRKPLDDTRKQGAWALYETLAIFTRETRNDMPLQYVISFLLVAMDEGQTVNTYAERAGVSKSVMSRHLLDIGPRARTGSTGFGLVETRRNLENMRQIEVNLTPKGRALVERILRFWQHTSRGD